ncbi:hypothetical protein [Spirosoma validum]|uniref:Uncharacterized protein n=1 Tax=Spirosoma validum TaxID=2771355 RepID=A0A927GD54_9BACT|nr:hypothetical protein [Spirosoma validum]MBD2753191.1 hypothetical protein [Spirosoma validum]
MDTSTIFPFFEKGLPLRSRDLNAVFRRADAEVRHTRTCLHGMGILYGLHVTVETNTITIQAGAGVTSEGHLYCSHTPVELTNSTSPASKIIKREFKAESFGDYLDRPSTTDELNDTVEHLELNSIGTPLTSETLANKWLIVFFEVVAEDLKGCATCDKGKRANVTTKFLLIDDKVWSGNGSLPGLSAIFDCGPNTATNQSNTFTPISTTVVRLSLPDADGDSNLSDLYKNSLNTSFPGIKDELIKTCGLADTIFGLGSMGKDAASMLDVPALHPKTNGQYLYDYLRLIIRAYNEFVTTPFTRHMANLPPKTCFPKHLALGKFDANGGFSDDVRTPFYRPIFSGTTDTDFEYARQLYERLISLLINADFGSLDTEAKKELRITPSRRATFPVGMQAIPFYLKTDALQKNWRPASQFDALILSYDGTKRLQHQPFFDESDFYRIEGHVNQKITLNDKKKNQFEDLRDSLNLPFQVVLVKPLRGQDDVPSLTEFARQNPGLEHQGGVPSGGTFVVVVSGEGNTILGDFCLPYWVQPPTPKPVIADFEIKSQTTKPNEGETFVLFSTSENQNDLEWHVKGSNGDGTRLSADNHQNEYAHFFPLTNLPATHYLVTLTAKKDGRESVEKTTIVVINQKEQTPPKASFAVDAQENGDVSENGDEIKVTFTDAHKPFEIKLIFQNKSENADEYRWQLDGKLKSKAKNTFSQKFVWVAGEADPQTFTIQLTASRDGLIDIAEKTVTASLPSLNPID